MENYKDLPINIRVEKAKNELRFRVNQICDKYDLPGCIIDLIIDSIKSEENQQRIYQICEQVNIIQEETRKQEESGVVDNGNKE